MLVGKVICHNVVKQERGSKIVMEVMMLFATDYVLLVGISMDFPAHYSVTYHVQTLVTHSTIPRPKVVDKFFNLEYLETEKNESIKTPSNVK